MTLPAASKVHQRESRRVDRRSSMVGVAGSALAHLLVGALMFWLPGTPPPRAPEQTVEMMFAPSSPVPEASLQAPVNPEDMDPEAAGQSAPPPVAPAEPTQPSVAKSEPTSPLNAQAQPTPPPVAQAEPAPQPPVAQAEPPPQASSEATLAPVHDPPPARAEAPKRLSSPTLTTPPQRPVVKRQPTSPPVSLSSTSASSNAAAAPPQQQVAPASVSGQWQQALAAWLAAHKTYPDQARRRGQEGTVALRFTVERSGRVTEVALARSSGLAVLDTAAEALLRAATLPSFTGAMAQDRVTVTMQIRYMLTE